MKTIYQIRYWLELIALPTFAFLVFHMTGHAMKDLVFENINLGNLQIFAENFAGIFLLILFVWLWHRPVLKKWVPCAHTHCAGEKDKSITPHIIAIIALCLHFFPEAAVREVLFEDFAKKEAFIGLIGFISHFFVDVIVAVLISGYWKKRSSQILSFLFMAGIWVLAYYTGRTFFDFIPENLQGMLFLIGGFFLAMFVHMPHKPVSACEHSH
jgi:hypothetical protein